MLILSAMIGVAMLIMGRQLFWVSVAGLGFLLGMNYATQFFQGSNEAILLVSLGVGFLGAVLAYALQRAAAGLVGFLAGWYLSIILMGMLQWNLAEYEIIFSMIAGIIGVVLISILFDWSLILISSITGATIVSQSMRYNTNTNIILFIILFLLGFIIQSIVYTYEKDNLSS